MMSDEERATKLATEMQRLMRIGDIPFAITAPDAFTLISCLQLAYRHPELNDFHKRVMRDCVENLARPFAECPVILETIRMGWEQ
ncbi:MAG: hypothetical protein ABW123_06170 [Cystobacter sp.]